MFILHVVLFSYIILTFMISRRSRGSDRGARECAAGRDLPVTRVCAGGGARVLVPRPGAPLPPLAQGRDARSQMTRPRRRDARTSAVTVLEGTKGVPRNGGRK